jgi:PAS domain-containing protein
MTPGTTVRRSRDMQRHKRVLIAVRLVLFIMISSLSLPEFFKGSISPILPIVLAAYLLTNLGMTLEKSQAFFSQRVQAFMLLFDIAILVVAMAIMERYRQDLFLAMFLVVLLASAGQRLTVSIGGFVAIAAFYAWFSLQGKEESVAETLGTLASGLPVLLVVAIYVGYVSETVARERRRREQAEEHLTREVQGMNRLQALGAGNVAEQDSSVLLTSLADTACDLLGAPRAALFWRPRGEAALRSAGSRGFPAGLAARWAAAPPPDLARGLDGGPVRLLDAADPALAQAGPEVVEALLAPLADRVDGTQAVVAVLWDRPHEHIKVEEEALLGLAQQAALILENASLYRLLSQTRDLWQAAFQSIPTPVVIIDAASRVVQANPAFLSLGAFDLSTLVGSSFSEVLEGASTPGGHPAGDETAAVGTVRLTIPRLQGEFDVTRGPYLGPTPAGGGIVWVLRKLSAGVKPV